MHTARPCRISQCENSVHDSCGTSGIKAAINGVPNLSILDGWWREGWQRDPANGWGIEPSPLGGDDQDNDEANAIYDLLESRVVPLYYDRGADGIPERWANVAKEAIRTIAPRFSTRRMVIEYIRGPYLPASGLADDADGQLTIAADD